MPGGTLPGTQRHRARCVAFLLTAILTVLACAVSAADVPRRIVSLVPATTEMLFAIGAGDRVVGVSSYDRFPTAVDRLPHLGGLLDPNLERLLTLRPDLVVVYDTQEDVKRQLAAAGVPIFRYVHRGLSDVTATLKALGKAVGSQAQAAALADRMTAGLDGIRARAAGRPRPRTLLVIGREPGTLRNVEASGGYGFLHDLLELAGGADVLADIPRQSVTLSTEMILARAPELVIELRYGGAIPPDQIEREKRAWNALPSVPAVKHGRVYLLVGDEFVVPGPRIVQAAEALEKVIHS
jgi:iron complex transport system substrate-binding protein